MIYILWFLPFPKGGRKIIKEICKKIKNEGKNGRQSNYSTHVYISRCNVVSFHVFMLFAN